MSEEEEEEEEEGEMEDDTKDHTHQPTPSGAAGIDMYRNMGILHTQFTNLTCGL